jgi:hypothetical protein
MSVLHFPKLVCKDWSINIDILWLMSTYGALLQQQLGIGANTLNDRSIIFLGVQYGSLSLLLLRGIKLKSCIIQLPTKQLLNTNQSNYQTM